MTTGALAAVSLMGSAAAEGANVAPRNLLSSRYSGDTLAALLNQQQNWQPFPKITDRAKWEQLPPDVIKTLGERGQVALKQPWPMLPATAFLDFVRNGNRSRFESFSFGRRNKLRDLVIAECAEGKGRYLDEILNGVWLICEETFWGVSAHLGVQKAGSGLPDISEPIIDLFAAETASLLAWTHYFTGEQLNQISKLVVPRIKLEVNRRILTPGLQRDDFGWMGFRQAGPNQHPPNNWNPWINSNWLTSSLLLDDDMPRRTKTVSKILRSLDQFLNGYPDDGACDEGPSYWGRAGASLFDCLELLRSFTNGKIDVYDQPLIANIGTYIYRAHIANDYFMNFGDAPAKIHVPGPLIYRYGKRIKDREMTAFGSAVAHEDQDGLGHFESLGRTLPALFALGELRPAEKYNGLLRDVWLKDSEIMAARTEDGSDRGFYLGVKGGQNQRSHGHNDAGNFLLFSDGKPVIIDVGVEAYTAKTFSSRRYDIWTMQSAFHNLPTINNQMQDHASTSRASNIQYRADDASAEISMDLAAAYPPQANIKNWNRAFSLNRRRNVIELKEEFSFSRPVSNVMLTLMTPCAVKQVPDSGLLLSVDGKSDVTVQFDTRRFKAEVEPIQITDSHLRDAWGDKIYRILFRFESPQVNDSWHVLFTRGAQAQL